MSSDSTVVLVGSVADRPRLFCRVPSGPLSLRFSLAVPVAPRAGREACELPVHIGADEALEAFHELGEGVLVLVSGAFEERPGLRGAQPMLKADRWETLDAWEVSPRTAELTKAE